MKPRLLAAILLVAIFVAATSSADVPDLTHSFYVPQVGAVATPTEGNVAIRFFRGCPNNDGATSYPNNARIKVHLGNSSGDPIAGVAAADIFIKFNGGTAEQGFTGDGADSIIANGTYNVHPTCPLIQYLYADAPTDVNGNTYITFAGANPANPGVAVRDYTRKWGHYDSELPVYALGVQLQGRLTTASFNNTYVLRIKSYDFRGGLGTELDQGEVVSLEDVNAVAVNINVSDLLSYWRDFDSSGSVTSSDLNVVNAHLWHTCARPSNP